MCSSFRGERSCRRVISIKLLSYFTEITLRHGCSPVNLLHIFRTPFPENTSGWLLLQDPKYASVHESQQKANQFRSSHRMYSMKTGVLKGFAKFLKKHRCARVSYLIKLQDWCPLTGRTYFNKPSAFSFQVQVCLSMYGI